MIKMNDCRCFMKVYLCKNIEIRSWWNSQRANRSHDLRGKRRKGRRVPARSAGQHSKTIVCHVFRAPEIFRRQFLQHSFIEILWQLLFLLFARSFTWKHQITRFLQNFTLQIAIISNKSLHVQPWPKILGTRIFFIHLEFFYLVIIALSPTLMKM